MSRAIAIAFVLVACGGKPPTPASDKPATRSCDLVPLAQAAASFVAAGRPIWRTTTCMPETRNALEGERKRYVASLASVRDVALDAACGPGGAAVLFPYEEILTAMDDVVAACDHATTAPPLGEAMYALRDALVLVK